MLPHIMAWQSCAVRKSCKQHLQLLQTRTVLDHFLLRTTLPSASFVVLYSLQENAVPRACECGTDDRRHTFVVTVAVIFHTITSTAATFPVIGDMASKARLPKRTLTVAAAQISSKFGDIHSNAAKHAAVIRQAENLGVDLLVFPELSLTGYALPLAKTLQLDIHDAAARRDVLGPVLSAHSNAHVTSIVGLPLADPSGKLPFLGALAIGRGESGELAIDAYAKIFVHESEAPYFQCGTKPVVRALAGGNVGLAICRDLKFPEHAAALSKLSSTVYACSALVEPSAYKRDCSFLQSYAVKHSMAVVLANYASKSGDLVPIGRSCVWAANGDKVASADATEECLVTATFHTGPAGEVLNLETCKVVPLKPHTQSETKSQDP